MISEIQMTHINFIRNVHVDPRRKETIMAYFQVFISAEERVQAMAIMTHLLKKRLAFGGPVFSGPAKFLWDNKIVENDYCYAITYTRDDLKDVLTREAERVSAEIVCMISFVPFEGNKALIDLLDAAFKDRETAPEPQPMGGIAYNDYLTDAEVATRTRSSFE